LLSKRRKLLKCRKMDLLQWQTHLDCKKGGPIPVDTESESELTDDEEPWCVRKKSSPDGIHQVYDIEFETRYVSVIHLLITQYTYRFYTKLKTTKKKTIKYSKLYIIELK
jgi:hypothetical protein